MAEVNYYDAGDMPPQTADWTCSACSLAWMNRALSIDVANSEWTAVDYIGNPENINASYGLMDASGRRLAQCLSEQGAPAFTWWPSYAQALKFASTCGVLLGGVGWNHWVAARMSMNNVIWIANSAPGWMGVYDELTEQQFIDLGPFAAVVVPIDYSFPPPTQA